MITILVILPKACLFLSSRFHTNKLQLSKLEKTKLESELDLHT